MTTVGHVKRQVKMIAANLITEYLSALFEYFKF